MKRSVKTFLKFLLIFVLILSILAGCTVGAIVLTTNDVFTEFNADDINLNFTSFLYYTDENGNDVEYQQLSGTENRIWADLEDISPYLTDAIVAIEDERFWSHKGFDLKRFTGATLNYVLKSDNSYGGSTITQQLIKNLTGDDDAKVARKLREIIRAIQLEQQMDKESILELYMNTIYLGQGCNGVKTAAYTYFGKDVSELNLAESASLAGITQYPTQYDPIINPDANIQKQHVVLEKMLELGYISQQEYQDAIDYDITFGAGVSEENQIQSYFVDAVIDEVLQDLQKEKGYALNYAAKLLYNGGLQIYTTLDPRVQTILEEEYAKDENFGTPSGEEQVESAMVIMDPYTGEIKALVGGRGNKESNRTLNRATQTTRQPGSTIKPIAVYGPAMNEGLIGPGTIIVDKKLTLEGWTPKNYDHSFSGPTSVRNAIARSINIVAVKTLQMLGLDTSYEYMTEKFHFTTLIEKEKAEDGNYLTDKQYPGLALGGLTYGVNVKEMTAAYATFANNGVHLTPHTYTKVLDANGNVLLEKNVEETEVFSEEANAMIMSCLRSVVTGGTGTAAWLGNGISSAGKTGTTDNAHDLWFCGVSPYYAGAVWCGFDQPKNLYAYVPDSISTQIWGIVMRRVHSDLGLEARDFIWPTDVNYNLSINNEAGKADDDEDKDEDEDEDEDEEESPTPSEEPSETPSEEPSASPSVEPEVSETPTVTPVVTPTSELTPSPESTEPPIETPATQTPEIPVTNTEPAIIPENPVELPAENESEY